MLGTNGGARMTHNSTPCVIEKVNDDNEVVYIGLASAYYYLDPSNVGEMDNIHAIKTTIEIVEMTLFFCCYMIEIIIHLHPHRLLIGGYYCV